MVNSGGEYILYKTPDVVWGARPNPGSYPDGANVSQFSDWQLHDGIPVVSDYLVDVFPNKGGHAKVDVIGMVGDDPELEIVFPLAPLDAISPEIPSIVRISVQLTFEQLNLPSANDKYAWNIDLSELMDHVTALPSGYSITSPHVRQFVKSFWGFSKGFIKTQIPSIRVGFNPYFGVKPSETWTGRLHVWCEWMSTHLVAAHSLGLAEPVDSFHYRWELKQLQKRHRKRTDSEDSSFELCTLDPLA